MLFIVVSVAAGPPSRAQAPGAETGPGAEHHAAPAAAPPAPPAPTSPTKRNIAGPGDYSLRERLVNQIRKDPELAKETFGVVLVNGGAVFSGDIRSCALKTRVLRMAALQPGIINVTDEMEVPRGGVTDAALRDAIQALLADKSAAPAIRDLRIDVDDGVATLAGTVDTYPSRVRAEDIAGAVLGVRRISNHLIPADSPSGTDDQSLTTAIIKHLGNFQQFAYAADMQVATRDGIVTLTGRVALLQARQLAGALAALVGGVKGVDNRIELDVALILQRRTIVVPVK